MKQETKKARTPFSLTAEIRARILPKKKGRVCIGGYAGCGNLGDDAILQGVLSTRMKAKDPALITVLSGCPRRDTRRFGVRCVNRKNPFAVFLALLRSEKFLCGGGSLLQNQTGDLSLYYYLGLLWLAQRLNCKTSLLAGGIGPLIGTKAQQQVVDRLNSCYKVEVRDTHSYRLLCSLGVRKELLCEVDDPALCLPLPPPSRLSFLLWEHQIAPSQRYMCIIAQPPRTEFDRSAKILGATLRAFCHAHGLLPLFAVFDPAHDTEFTCAIMKKCDGKLIRLREAADATALLQGAQLAVCMRLHALILSQLASTPAVGIPPLPLDQKMESFCRSAAFPCLPLADQSIVSLTSALEEIVF